MKHGDKAKAKAAKASRKASDKKSSKASGAGKKTHAVKATKAGKAGIAKASAVKSSPPSTPKGAGNARIVVEAAGFANPAVAAAFKRAVKKYPNALRRLTD